jgi:type VI secretion system protein ImpE
MNAGESVREGRIQEALADLQERVRNDPSDAGLRIFLFQLLAVFARWDRALTQLNVLKDLDAGSLPMVHAYREALQCEALREEVFAGRRSPVIFGDPEPWIAQMVEALRAEADGRFDEASRLREDALGNAEPSNGTINGESFEWIADADSRLGPILEAIVNGRYCWVPFRRIRQIRMEAPTDLRDLVWQPAQITWSNQGEVVALIPSRYPGAAPEHDAQILMARRTEWTSPAPDVYVGQGQRILATDRDEYPLFEAKEIELANEDPASEETDGG